LTVCQKFNIVLHSIKSARLQLIEDSRPGRINLERLTKCIQSRC